MATGSNTGQLVFTTGVATSNVTTVETTLATCTIGANSLGLGYAVKVTGWGSVASSASTMTVKFYFGGTSVSFAALATTDATDFVVTGIVYVTGAATQVGYGSLVADGSTISTKVITPSAATTGSIIVKITGTGGASNEITLKGMIVEILD